MSVTQGIGALAIAILIGSIGPSSAQQAGASSTSLSLTENSWDFTKPDSIPGFGTLPQSYDAQAALPKLSGK